MVDASRTSAALRALQWVIVRSRLMIQQGESSSAVEDCLDVAEYLAGLLADPDDQSDMFRAQLEQLAEKYTLMRTAIERLDS